MRKLLSLCLAVLITVCMSVSCANRSIPEKLDNFVSEAEQNSSNYSMNDWEKSRQEYQQLVDSYMNSDKKYSAEEKEMAAHAIGRYHALLIKNGFEQAASIIKQLSSIIPSYLEGFSEGLDKGVDSLSNSLEQIFDEQRMEESVGKLEDSMDKLEGAFEKIFK